MCGQKQAASILIFFFKQFFFSFKADSGGMRFIRLWKQQTQTKPLSDLFIVGFGVFVGFVDEKKNIKLVVFLFPGGCFGRRKKLQYFYQWSTVI